MARILRLPDVKEKTGLSRTSIYNKIADGTFPAPLKLTTKSSGWLDSEVDEFIMRLVHERDDAARVV